MFACEFAHPARDQRYHKAETLGECQEVMKNLQTGDVIMFFLSGIPACLARGSLYSHWDHIGIVIRRKGYSRELKCEEILPEELDAQIHTQTSSTPNSTFIVCLVSIEKMSFLRFFSSRRGCGKREKGVRARFAEKTENRKEIEKLLMIQETDFFFNRTV